MDSLKAFGRRCSAAVSSFTCNTSTDTPCPPFPSQDPSAEFVSSLSTKIEELDQLVRSTNAAERESGKLRKKQLREVQKFVTDRGNSVEERVTFVQNKFSTQVSGSFRVCGNSPPHSRLMLALYPSFPKVLTCCLIRRMAHALMHMYCTGFMCEYWIKACCILLVSQPLLVDVCCLDYTQSRSSTLTKPIKDVVSVACDEYQRGDSTVGS